MQRYHINISLVNVNVNIKKKKSFDNSSTTLEENMKNAKLMETMSLVLLLLVGLLSPIIIFLVKNATSTIQVKTKKSLDAKNSSTTNAFSSLQQFRTSRIFWSIKRSN